MTAIYETNKSLSDLFALSIEDVRLLDPVEMNLFLRDPKMRSPSGCHLDLLELLQRMVLLLAKSIVEHDLKGALEVYKLALASLQFLGSDSKLPLGLFVKPHIFFRDEVRFLHVTLLKSLYIMFDERRFLPVIEATQIEELLELSPFCFAADRFFKEHHLPRWEGEEVAESLLPIGFHNLSDDHKTLIINCFGYGASMGSIEVNGVQIRAFGPQVGQIGQMEAFGCFRIDGDPFLAIDQEVSCNRFKGWTKLFGGADCIHVDISKEEEVKLKIKLVKMSDSSSFFTFFVAADKLVLASGEEVLKKSLYSYRGLSQSVSLYKGGCLEITAPEKVPMTIIPLEGKSHFWGADYLIAFELADGNFIFK